LLVMALAISALAIGLVVWSGGWIGSAPETPNANRNAGAYAPPAGESEAGRSIDGDRERQVFGIPLPGSEDGSAGEPAGLPAPPGGERMMRSTAGAGGTGIDSSVWRVPDGDAARLASFYERAGEAAGFETVRKRAESGGETHHLLMRRAKKWLQVDCRSVRGGVRIVVQLR
jgi:hypothetical protein